MALSLEGGTTGLSAASGYARGATQAESTRLLAEAQRNSGSSDTARIAKAGKEFESILLGSWLQGAEESFATAPGGDEAEQDDGSREQFLGMAMQQLAGSLVEAGGIGISRMIVSHLEQAATPAPTAGSSSGGLNALRR